MNSQSRNTRIAVLPTSSKTTFITLKELFSDTRKSYGRKYKSQKDAKEIVSEKSVWISV